MARLELLGPPRWVDDRGARPLPPTLTSCLAARLAVDGGWVPRARLLPLFWPDASETKARGNLRQLLRAMPATLQEAIERDGEALRFAGPGDVADALLLEHEGVWVDALRLHRGPLLDGFAPRRAPAFEDWVDEERTRWTHRFRALAHRAFDAAIAAADRTAAVETADLWVERDPVDEEVVGYVATALDGLGIDGDAVDRIWSRHRRALDVLGIGVEPDPAPRRPRVHRFAELPVGRSALANRSTAAAPIGRTHELAALDDWWASGARWCTVVAPGGMGKTTLVRAWLEGAGDRDVPFDLVDLNAVSTGEEATRRALAALGRGSAAGVAGLAGMTTLVGSRPHLLVADAVEDLVDGAAVLAGWLGAAPGLRLLATSRRVLDGRGERRVRLGGVSVLRPPSGGPSAAAKLVWARALELTGGADGTGSDAPPDEVQAAVERLGGWPLGLVLLAGWAAWLGLEAWSAALAAGGPDHGDADASRSIGASWDHLGGPLQNATTVLAALPRPWQSEDAAAAGVASEAVAELTATGWLTPGPDGFTMHPLLAEHASARDPHRFERARTDHARRELTALAAAHARDGRPPRGTWRRLHHLLAAWGTACDAGDLPALMQAHEPFFAALSGARRLDDVGACLQRTRETLATLAPDAHEHDEGPTGAFLRRLLGAELATWFERTDRTGAAPLAERIAAAGRASGDRWSIAQATGWWAIEAYRNEGDVERTDRLAREGLAAVEGHPDRRSLAAAGQLANLIGLNAARAGRLEEGRSWIERATRYAREAGGASSAAGWEHNLVHLDARAGRYHRALARNRSHLEAAELDGAPIALAERWSMRGALLAALGDAIGARTAADRLEACSRGMHAAAGDGWRAEALHLRAEAALIEGDPHRALQMLDGRPSAVRALLLRAAAALAMDDVGAALNAARDALARLHEAPPSARDPIRVGEAEALRAEALVRAGDPGAGGVVAEVIAAALARSEPPVLGFAARSAAAWVATHAAADLAAPLAHAVAHASFVDALVRRAVRDALDQPAPEVDAPPSATGVAALRTALHACKNRALVASELAARGSSRPRRATDAN